MKKLISILVLLFAFSFPGSAQNKIDSLKSLISKATPDTNKVKTIEELTWEVYLSGDFDEALKNANEGFALSQQLNYEKGKANLYHQMGNIYYSKSNYSKSIENYLNSLKLKEKIGLRKSFASTYGSIGNVYQAQGNYEKALEYQLKGLELNKEFDNKYSIGVSLNNIGNVYGRTNRNELAMKYFMEAVVIEEEIEDFYGLSQSLGNVGNIYKAQKNYPKSLEYILRSLKIQEEIGDKQGIAGSMGNIGTLYLEQGNYKKALEYLNASILQSSELGMKEYVKESYRDLSLTYEKLGQTAKALEFYKKFTELKDSILNDENNKHIAQTSAQYESEKKDNEIKLLNKDKEKIEAVAATESKKQKIIIIAVTLGLLFVLVFAFFIYRSNREKQKANIEITRQKEIIEERNKEVHDSITYAKRIQTAILPPDKLIKKHLTNSFVLFKPKDIVSGDFYWMESVRHETRDMRDEKSGIEKISNLTTQYSDLILFAAVDCTGHGVPGAMVSVVGHNGLNRTVKEFGLTQPAAILDKLTELVEETFEKSESAVKDGMDISLCCLNRSNNILEWSGANNPIWILRNMQDGQATEMEVLKADKQPIGVFDYRKPFTNHSIQLNKGDSIYIFTDGFADQFGGPKGKKFKYKQLEELLLSSQANSMEEQKQILDKAFEDWRIGLEQIDDVCIIGVRL